jgi:uncharacterized protein with HEPN domain
LIAAAEKIGRVVKDRTFDEFTADETRFDAVLFNLQVIGEAVKHLPEAVRAAIPEIDWPKAPRLKGIIAHHHFALDANIIWDVAVNHVPKILAAAKSLADQPDDDLLRD